MEASYARAVAHSTLFETFAGIARQTKQLWRSRRQRKALVVRETAPLGERRFVAIVQFERQRYLIGGGPASVTLLAQLPDEKSAGAES